MVALDRKATRRDPKRASSEEMVDAILRATELVLADVGVEHATVAMVAKRAGVGPGTLFYYFPTKAALLAAWEEGFAVRAATLVVREAERLLSMRVPLDYGIRRLVHLGCAIQRRHQSYYRSSRPAVARLARFDEALAIANRGAALLAEALSNAPGHQPIRPRDVELALRLVIQTVAVMSYLGHAQFKDRIESEAFREELAALVARYLLGDAADRAPDPELDPSKDLPTLGPSMR
jgi:AcrR family transcriptional regulator